MDDYTPGPLPEPDMEDVSYELWGQNVVHPALYGTTKMHAYARAEVAREVAAAVAKERERCARVCESMLTDAERYSGPEAAGWLIQAADKILASRAAGDQSAG